ncbi:hypothetical protein FBQ85_19340 [Cytophagia bacterium CHB2]|nr:hypothetical protein [Cytophagia bacterium CHB2]
MLIVTQRKIKNAILGVAIAAAPKAAIDRDESGLLDLLKESADTIVLDHFGRAQLVNTLNRCPPANRKNNPVKGQLFVNNELTHAAFFRAG